MSKVELVSACERSPYQEQDEPKPPPNMQIHITEVGRATDDRRRWNWIEHIMRLERSTERGITLQQGGLETTWTRMIEGNRRTEGWQ